MSCRNSRLSSALVTFARDMTGLQDVQILALNHALMREGAHTPLDPTAWGTLIDRVEAEFRTGTLRIRPGSSDPSSRLQAARTESPDAGRAYAAERLLRRAELAQTANTTHLEAMARRAGMTMDQINREFTTHFATATADARVHASPAFIAAWNRNPSHANLFVDRRSMFVYEQLEAQHPAMVPETRQAVTREAVNHSAVFAEMGYDPETCRLECVMHSNLDRVYAYRMTPTEYEEFVSTRSLGSYFARHIRGNDNYAYATQEEADAAATVTRCLTCGQFAAPGHSCPVPGSPTSIASDVAAATILASLTAQRTAAALPTPVAVAAPVAVPAPVAAALDTRGTVRDGLVAGALPVVTFSRTTRYATPNVSLRSAGLGRLRTEARANGDVLTEVQATVRPGYNVVSGLVQIHSNAPRRGYVVTPDMLTGTTRHLRCSCAAYRTDYRCEHTDAVYAGMTTLLNQTQLEVNAARAAAATATAGVAAGYTSSVASTAASTAAFVPLGTSFTDSPDEFQGLYAEARAKQVEYKAAIARGETAEYPVPYLTDNVFGGMAKRGSGRGVGIEIEYAFPRTMSASAMQAAKTRIGVELYAAGLTRTERQGGYGASHGWTRDHHARGWSYESDPTTGGRDDASGGEIVSPIMYDEPDTWQNIKTITEIINRNGAISSKGSGMHVHVGVGDYNHRVENHTRLMNAFADSEDLMYRLSSNPERGSHRGPSWCAPNSAPSSAYTDVGAVRRNNNSHNIGINMQSVAGRGGDHIEIRTFDSTLNPAVMQAQMAVAVYVAQGATRAETATSTGPTATRARLGTRYAANPTRAAQTGDAWNASTLPVRAFLDKFVPGNGGAATENPQVRQLAALFAITKWQKR